MRPTSVRLLILPHIDLTHLNSTQHQEATASPEALRLWLAMGRKALGMREWEVCARLLLESGVVPASRTVRRAIATTTPYTFPSCAFHLTRNDNSTITTQQTGGRRASEQGGPAGGARRVGPGALPARAVRPPAPRAHPALLLPFPTSPGPRPPNPTGAAAPAPRAGGVCTQVRLLDAPLAVFSSRSDSSLDSLTD